jgi:class 3 adenylate cyclase/DNA-binding response OmpR family regulator/predicted ATPase
MRHRVLVVAQDVTLRSTLARWLVAAGYLVELAENDRRARQVLANQRMALTVVVLTAGTPVFDPGEKGGKLVIATERSQDLSPLTRSAIAADAYLSIPLDEHDVLGRLESVLHPPAEAPPATEILCFDGFTVDLAGRSLRDGDGSEVLLTRAEFALLVVLARHPGRVLSRDQLLDAALGRRAEPYDRSIDVLVGRLRRKIEPDPKVPRFIVTVLGEGYKFAARPRETSASVQATPTAPSGEERRAHPLSTERRQLTVMSCGLVGSTALASRLDPEDLCAVFAEYHRCCTEVIAPFGGIVAPFAGDHVLAYFGYPEAHENDAERAVRGGLALIDAVTELTIRLAPSLHVRVGIASGLVVVGGAGPGGGPLAPIAIGEAPDLAAQLQSRAPPDTVLIAASTRDLVRGLFDYRQVGPLALEGLAEPAPAWQVVGTSAAESRFEALREGNLTPLVGRDEEIDLLLRRWQQIQSGEGRVALISGEPGIGKSRLVRASQDRLANHAALSFYCSPSYQDSPLYPVITQLERAAGFRRDDTPKERFAKLEALLHPSIGKEATALIAALLSVPSGERYPAPDLNPQRRKQKTLAALVAQFTALASERPVLAVFEDAHWMDPTSRELLDALVDRARNLPVLLLVTYRPEFTPPWASHPHATTVVLNRLGSRQVSAMADQMAGKRLPRGLHRQIVDLSDGVPLFVEEVVKTVLESGLLHELDDEYLLRGPLPPLALPNTLQGLLVARLDRLGPAKEVAQTGAALGREFSYEVIRAVADWLPEPRLQEVLQSLVESELLYRRSTLPDVVYLFKHALLQDAAHETLLRSRRRELHARIAAVLEERFPEVAEQQPGLLAHHYTEAGSIEQAVIYWRKAGRQSAARSAMIEAEAQLRRGLLLLSDLPDSRERKRQELDLLVTLASALRESKGHVHPEVAGVLAHARSLIIETEATGTILHFSVLYGLWVAQYLGGEPVAALEQAKEFMSLAQSQTQSGLRLVGHRLIGSALVLAGRNYPSALSHLDRAVELYRPEEHRELAFRFGADIGITAQCVRGLALWHCGYPDQALKAVDEGLRHARQSVHRHTLAYALIYKGLTAVSARWAAETEEAANELVSHTREHGFALFLGYGLLLQAAAMVLRGQGEAAVKRIHESVAAMRATGMNRSEPMVLGYLAEGLALTGALTEGLRALAGGLAAAEASGTHWADAELHRLRGDLLGRLPSNDWTEVEACFRTALSVAREQGTRGFELRGAVSLARLLSAEGRRDEARDVLAPIHGWFTEGFDTPDLQEAKSLLETLDAQPLRRQGVASAGSIRR